MVKPVRGFTRISGRVALSCLSRFPAQPAMIEPMPKADLFDIGLGAVGAALVYAWTGSAFPALFTFSLFAVRPLATAYWRAVKDDDG